MNTVKYIAPNKVETNWEAEDFDAHKKREIEADSEKKKGSWFVKAHEGSDKSWVKF